MPLLNKLSKLPKTYCSGEDREPEAGLERDSKSASPLLFHLRYSIITPASQFTKNKLHHGHMLLKQCPQVGSTVNMRHQAGGGDVKVKRWQAWTFHSAIPVGIFQYDWI